MNHSNSYKSKQFLALVVKLFIVIGCGYFMYAKIFKNEQQSIPDFLSILVKNDAFLFKNVLFLFIFTSFNWFLEILKWRNLVSFYQKTTFKSALIQSLSSLTASLITPNRIGEYGVKALYFKKSIRKQIVVMNLAGNLSQLIVTIFFGIVGCSYLFFKFSITIAYTNIFIVLFFSIFLLLSLWFIDKKEFAFKGYSTQYFKKLINAYPKKLIKKVLLYSVFRYLVFSHQFYFLVLIFNIQLNYLDAMTSIFAMYLIASIIPMLSLFDVVVKGSVAIFIFSLFDVSESVILAIVLLMWIFNFVLPSIVGSYFVLTFKTDTLIQQKK